MLLCILSRRGARINGQNLAGNTAAHYAFAYDHHDLGMYLVEKGANDSVVNSDGLTCYEGLSTEDLEDI